MTTRHSIRGSRWVRVAAAVGIAALPACVVWSAFDGPGWVDDGPSYRFVTLSALGALVAAFAAVSLAGIQTLSGESFGLFTSRRPAPVAALWLVAMVALGLALCGAIATHQGDTPWEPSDKGWFVGWAVHFLVIGGLLVLLWWLRARAVWIVVAPVLSGLLAFAMAPPGGWAEEGADLRDDATFADGFHDVLPYMLVAVLLMGVMTALVTVRVRPSSGTRQPAA